MVIYGGARLKNGSLAPFKLARVEAFEPQAATSFNPIDRQMKRANNFMGIIRRLSGILTLVFLFELNKLFIAITLGPLR